MNNIHKFSKGLLVIFFIEIGDIVLFFIGIIIGIIINKEEAVLCSTCLKLCLDILISILNLIFFILLSVNYYQSSFKDFEDFGICYYLNGDFSSTYQYIFNLMKDFNKVFILNIVFLSLNACANCLKQIGKKS